ncbi:UNVERIFIED_CONTAM: Mitochondrial fission 1 protein A [Sesamum latifolium]|uniref:Mitochondrial fission 1 protein A n=1 Tax=Sesamum latifolium TaxID=2727402 RepID=A0AAW2XZA5_9LAMI
MDAKFGKFFESVGNFFTGGDQIPWCDSDIVAGCEREVAEAEKGSSDKLKGECIMRLSWALVHSKRAEDVQRGIAMLEDIAVGSFINTFYLSYLFFGFSWTALFTHVGPLAGVESGFKILIFETYHLQLHCLGLTAPCRSGKSFIFWLLDTTEVGYYSKSRQLVERCLEIAPDWRQALTLKKALEDKITKDESNWYRHCLQLLLDLWLGVSPQLFQLARSDNNVHNGITSRV